MSLVYNKKRTTITTILLLLLKFVIAICSSDERTLNDWLSVNTTNQQICFDKQWMNEIANTFSKDNCMENRSEMVEMLLKNISKTEGFVITSKPYKHRNKPNFCLSKFSNKLEAISCDHPYFMNELRLIEDEIILALKPDSLDMFLHILQTNGIYHLRMKIIGIPTSNLNNFQEIFPSMSLNSLEDGKRFTQKMIEEFSMSIQELTTREMITDDFPKNKKKSSTIIKSRAIPQRINIKMVTVFFTNLIVEVPPTTYENTCGLEAKVCTIPEKNGTKLLSWRQGCCSGKLIALIEKVRKQLGFTYSLYIVEDGKWGSKENETWNGMIKDLVDGKADFALQILDFLKQRHEALDYTNFIGTLAYGILRIKKVKKEFPDWNFLGPLSTNLKWVLCGTAFFSIFIILILENGRFLTNETFERFQFQETMTYVFGLTFQRDMGATNPRMWSGRLVALGYAAAMTIIMSIYTARITADGIQGVVKDDFKGFDDERFINPTEKYKFTSVGGQGIAIDVYFKNHQDEKFRRMYKFMSKYFVKSQREGFEKLVNGTIQAFILSSYAYDTFIQPLLHEAGCPEGVELFPKTTSPNGYGFMYPKNFHYGDIISQAVQKIYLLNDFEALSKKWDLDFQPVCQNQKHVASRFGWKYFSGVLVIVVVTTILGCILNIFEHIFVYFYEKKYLNIKTRNDKQKKQQSNNNSAKRTSNKRKLVSANRALSAYLKDTVALEDHAVFSFQHENQGKFSELTISETQI